MSIDATISSRLRVSIFSESFHPVRNGVVTSISTLVEGLRQQGHSVTSFAPRHQGAAWKETNVIRFPSFILAKYRDYPLAYPFLPQYVLSKSGSLFRYDVVHSHTPFVMGQTGASMAIQSHIPHISTFHTLYAEYSHYVPIIPQRLTRFMLERFLLRYYNQCAEIICPSKIAAEYLTRLGIVRPISVIPTGVPLPRADSLSAEAILRIRIKYNIGSTTGLLLYAGRLAPEKNLLWLLTAFKRILERLPNVQLIIAGSGPLDNELRMITKRDLPEGSVCFTGSLCRDELDTMYAAADLFCLTSLSETQGLVVNEARACGTPGVVLNSGGSAESVQDGIDGFCIEKEDLEGYVDCVISLLRNRIRLELLRQNCLRIARLYTPSEMTNRILEVYRRAIADQNN